MEFVLLFPVVLLSLSLVFWGQNLGHFGALFKKKLQMIEQNWAQGLERALGSEAPANGYFTSFRVNKSTCLLRYSTTGIWLYVGNVIKRFYVLCRNLDLIDFYISLKSKISCWRKSWLRFENWINQSLSLCIFTRKLACRMSGDSHTVMWCLGLCAREWAGIL